MRRFSISVTESAETTFDDRAFQTDLFVSRGLQTDNAFNRAHQTDNAFNRAYQTDGVPSTRAYQTVPSMRAYQTDSITPPSAPTHVLADTATEISPLAG